MDHSKSSKNEKTELLNWISRHAGKSTQFFHVSLLEPYKGYDRPNREQPPREPEDVEGDMEWEVEKIVKSEIITYTRKVRRVDKEFKELRYFVKWAGCSEDENT